MLPSESSGIRWEVLQTVGYAGPADPADPMDGGMVFELTMHELDGYVASKAAGRPEEPAGVQKLTSFLLLLVASPEALLEAKRGGDLRVSQQAVRRARGAVIEYNISLLRKSDQVGPSGGDGPNGAAASAGAALSAGTTVSGATAASVVATATAAVAAVGNAAAVDVGTDARVEAGVDAEIAAQAMRVRERELACLVEWRDAFC
mmetsp:Transcript_53128/g.119230  ORF Transcript_53128/g.119230 Transcript_53128/m.119230 type:complete len:204 (-) Transcript_53128:269-880(-)